MEINTVASYKILNKGELADKTVVVVNCMRTNPTILTALVNGCTRVIPVDTVENAMEVRRQFHDALLCGEREACKIQGFDLGNSPGEYTAETVGGRECILVTSNGTRGINACFAGSHIVLGCLLNAKAAAEAVSGADNLYFVCVGTGGRLCVSDIFAMGAILDRMQSLGVPSVLDDCATLSLRTYREFRGRVRDLLAGVRDYENLTAIGRDEDIAYCLQEDVYNTVPVYEDGLITV